MNRNKEKRKLKEPDEKNKTRRGLITDRK